MILTPRVEALLRALDTSIHQSQALYALLLDELIPESSAPDTTQPQLIAAEDPAICQHPDTLEVLNQRVCNSCGTNLV